MKIRNYLFLGLGISVILFIICSITADLVGQQAGKTDIGKVEFENVASEQIPHEKSHFGFMHPDYLEEMQELPTYWQRKMPGEFIWGKIEPREGQFNWQEVDKEVRKSQEYGINILAVISPFANWEQAECREKVSSINTREFPKLGNYLQKPCDLDRYKNFIKTLVERYDDDGNQDMPGLKFPIKYWEVGNEPSFKGDAAFFVGTTKDYFEILQATYYAIKKADPEAKVLHGGMAVLDEPATSFWQEIFQLGGADYFDIANIHSVNSHSRTLYASEFKDFLKNNNIDKPFWITEAVPTAKELGKDDLSADEWAEQSVKIFVTAFAGGAEKIFYIGLEAVPGDKATNLIINGERQPSFYSFQTMVNKLDYFTKAEKIAEGQFKFIVKEKIIYVLWGDAELPSEISGKVRVTDIHGKSKTIDSVDLFLDKHPIFVELLV